MRIDDENVTEAISTAVDLRRQIATTAASIAETEDWIADTLDRMARSRPHDAERLRERAAHARKFAARERVQAAAYRSYANTGTRGWLAANHRTDPQRELPVAPTILPLSSN